MGPCRTWPSPPCHTVGLCLPWTPGTVTWSLTTVSGPCPGPRVPGAQKAGCVGAHARCRDNYAHINLYQCLIYGPVFFFFFFFFSYILSIPLFRESHCLTSLNQSKPPHGRYEEGVHLWLIHMDLCCEREPDFFHPSRHCRSRSG